MMFQTVKSENTLVTAQIHTDLVILHNYRREKKIRRTLKFADI